MRLTFHCHRLHPQVTLHYTHQHQYQHQPEIRPRRQQEEHRQPLYPALRHDYFDDKIKISDIDKVLCQSSNTKDDGELGGDSLDHSAQKRRERLRGRQRKQDRILVMQPVTKCRCIWWIGPSDGLRTFYCQKRKHPITRLVFVHRHILVTSSRTISSFTKADRMRGQVTADQSSFKTQEPLETGGKYIYIIA